MEQMMQRSMADTMQAFSLPRYEQLPNMGLYLEQTVKFVNQLFAPLGCVEITGSMVRNYVKMGLIENPVKKQYEAQHIAYIIAVTLLKQVVPLDQILTLFRRQKQVYPTQVAYDYFCEELEGMLCYIFGVSSDMEMVNSNHTSEKLLLRGIVTSVCYRLYLNVLLEAMDDETAID